MADKKNIFDKIGDALSNRDEKAAEEAKVEAARKEAVAKAQAATEKMQKDAEARSAERARVAANEKAAADAAVLAASQAAAQAAEQAKVAAERANATQQRIQGEFATKQAQIASDFKQKQADAAAEAAKYVKHTWTNEDTYASLAFKHYGSIKEPYWRLIYEYNKDIIGSHPNNIKTGTEIVIPPLPAELEKKDN